MAEGLSALVFDILVQNVILKIGCVLKLLRRGGGAGGGCCCLFCIYIYILIYEMGMSEGTCFICKIQNKKFKL